MIDISHWKHLGYGGKSTLEKEELSSPSPEEKKYLIKYHRQFTQGISWEDITEYIAAKIGELLGLTMMEVDIVTRNGRRGCLLTNFIEAYDADMAEEGGSLLANSDAYLALQQSTKKNEALLEEGLAIIEKFPYWSIIKENFIETILFDILIGNQDRHTFNWMLLFKEHHVIFSPIYDNGASLGFRLDDKQLLDYLTNTHKMHKYVRQAKVKAGLFEKNRLKLNLSSLHLTLAILIVQLVSLLSYSTLT